MGPSELRRSWSVLWKDSNIEWHLTAVMEESRDATNTCTFYWPENAAGDTAESWPAGDAGNMCKRTWSKALRSPDGKVWRLADLEQHRGDESMRLGAEKTSVRPRSSTSISLERVIIIAASYRRETQCELLMLLL